MGTGLPDPTDPPPPARVRVVSSALALHSEPDDLPPGYEPPPPPPLGAVLHPPAPADPATRSWLLVQIASELQLLGRMYFDPRYRISRTAQFVMPAIVGLFALNYFVFSIWFDIAIISPILERIGCVALGVLAYKVLVREMARYRDVLEYLNRFNR